MNLGAFLHSLLSGAGKTAQNVATNVTHPQQTLGNMYNTMFNHPKAHYDVPIANTPTHAVALGTINSAATTNQLPRWSRTPSPYVNNNDDPTLTMPPMPRRSPANLIPSQFGHQPVTPLPSTTQYNIPAYNGQWLRSF